VGGLAGPGVEWPLKRT